MTRRLAGALAVASLALAVPASAPALPIDVTTTADEYLSGPSCSLREAVRAASTDAVVGGCPAGEPAAVDEVRLGAGTYALSRPGAGEGLNATGDLDADTASGPIALVGPASGQATIDAAHLDRAIDVIGGFGFRLEHARIVNGSPPAVPALEGGGGLRWNQPAGTGSLLVVDSSFSGNAGLGGGGAIEAETAGEHTITRSEFSGNSSGYATIRSTGELSIIDSTVAENAGGGVAAEGALEMSGSTVSGHDNTDTRVGGILAAGDAVIENSTITNNIGGYFGGVEADGELLVRFSTIADNGAPGNVVTDGAAGIDGNDAESITLDGVIVAHNRLSGTEVNCNFDAAQGSSPSLESAQTCGLAALSGIDPQLAPLAANGGPTQTRGLYGNSPALDAAAGCGLAVDQRGSPRPGSSVACDLGAFEGTVPQPPIKPPPTAPVEPKGKICPKGKAADGKCRRCPKGKKLTRKGKCRKRGKAKARPRAALAASERVVIGRSVRGRAIVARRFGDPAAERVALAVGVIHGDERAGLRVLEKLRTDDLEGVQLWTIASLNPDGSRTRSRRNARGVDLNRNFPFRWRGGVPRSSGYYPGPRPASEPETRAAMRFIEEIRPDVSVWYHQPWGAVLACRGLPAIAGRYAKLAGMGTSCRGTALRGTAISWQNEAIAGSEAFVVEFGAGPLPQAGARRNARALAIIASDG